jgi:putative flippase GtrA
MTMLLRFVALSGLGWLCDMTTFTLLVKLAGCPAPLANIASSYAGVTFVWFTSLKSVFQHNGPRGGRYLLIYWGYQLLSILAYSHILGLVAAALPNPLIAKIFITPFNLVTNFIFMKTLTRTMRAP